MFYINFILRNPFWNNRWGSLKYWHGRVRRHKTWEIQIMKSDALLALQFDWTARTDHAGISLGFGLVGYCIDFSYNDTRHWDIKEQNWVTHD